MDRFASLVAALLTGCVIDVVDPRGLPCTADENCLAGETCCLGTCGSECRLLVCQTDGDCPNKAYACRDTVCEKIVPFECTADAACPSPQTCERGQRVCAAGQKACGSLCIPSDGCCSLADCSGRGDACESNLCRCVGLGPCSPGALCTDVGCVCAGLQCGDVCVSGHDCCDSVQCASGKTCADGLCL